MCKFEYTKNSQAAVTINRRKSMCMNLCSDNRHELFIICEIYKKKKIYICICINAPTAHTYIKQQNRKKIAYTSYKSGCTIQQSISFYAVLQNRIKARQKKSVKKIFKLLYNFLPLDEATIVLVKYISMTWSDCCYYDIIAAYLL